MIEIKLEEASTLPLQMNLEGDVDSAPTLRFSVLSEGVRYSFEATNTGTGEFEVHFPIMEGKLPAGVYDAEVEIIVDNKHFTPLRESVRFTKEVKPTVKLAEQMKKMDRPAMQVRVGTVAKTAPLRQITDVRELVATFNESEEIDSEFALKALNGLTLNESVVLDGFQIAPKRALSEAEAIAALRLIKGNGTDIDSSKSIWEGIKALSPKVAGELRTVLAEKGLSTRVLTSFGF